jgi:putative DNA primase/helicase
VSTLLQRDRHDRPKEPTDADAENDGRAQQANDTGGKEQKVVSLDEAREARKARAGPFRMDDLGLGQKRTKGSGKNKQEYWAHISTPFEIVGEARNPHGVDWGRYLRWRDSDGRLHARFVSNALLAEPVRLYALLAYDGLKIEPDQARALARYLAVAETAERVTIVSCTGWHEIGDLRVFVLPKETVGPKDASRVILDQAAHAPYEDRGSIKAWQESVARPASGHALAVLAISTALAGPLLHLAGLEGGGVHVFGPSSQGKTTLLRLAASVWGGPSFVRSWRATANGLEGAAAGSSDTLLVLDELS